MGDNTEDVPTLATIIDSVPDSQKYFHGPPEGADLLPLCRGKVNRVIQYGGCFNPPHQGHQEVITNALYRSGLDYNVVGLIIYTRSVDFLRRKYWGDDTLLLTQAQRINIWGQAKLSNVWICSEDEDEHSTIGLIKAAAQQLGYDIDFVDVVGTDYLPHIERYHNRWDNTLVVETKFRRPKRRKEPKQLIGWSEWKKAELDKAEWARYAEQFTESEWEAMKAAQKCIRCCTARHQFANFPEKRVRLILCRGKVTSLSSSRLRAVLSGYNVTKQILAATLEGYVVAPETALQEIWAYLKSKEMAITVLESEEEESETESEPQESHTESDEEESDAESEEEQEEYFSAEEYSAGANSEDCEHELETISDACNESDDCECIDD